MSLDRLVLANLKSGVILGNLGCHNPLRSIKMILNLKKLQYLRQKQGKQSLHSEPMVESPTAATTVED